MFGILFFFYFLHTPNVLLKMYLGRLHYQSEVLRPQTFEAEPCCRAHAGGVQRGATSVRIIPLASVEHCGRVQLQKETPAETYSEDCDKVY